MVNVHTDSENITIHVTPTSQSATVQASGTSSVGAVAGSSTRYYEQLAKQHMNQAEEYKNQAGTYASSASTSATLAGEYMQEVIESAPTATITQTQTGATITISDIHGTTSAEITNGTDGTDGFSPSASVVKEGNKATISITDKDGTTSAEIFDGSGVSSFSQLSGSPYDNTNLSTALNSKQGTLTASTGINLSSDTISVKIDNSTITTNSSGQLVASGSGGGLQNTATGSYSLTILGTPCAYVNAINIGNTSYVGENYCVALGSGASAEDNFFGETGIASIAIGGFVHSAKNSVSIGVSSQAYDNSIAIGSTAKANSSYTIQLGYGTNDTSNTMQVWNYPLLSRMTGKIPTDRLNLDTLADGQWVKSYATIASSVAFSENDVSYDLSSYLPNDGYAYEVMLYGWCRTGSTSGNRVILAFDTAVNNNGDTVYTCICGTQTRSTSTMTSYGSGIVPMYNRTLTVAGITNPNGEYTFNMQGYRRIGTNQ